MKVSQVMVAEVSMCRASETLDHAATLMWDRDIGCLPVIDDTTSRLVGILTDRDICMSAYARRERLDALPVTLAMACSVVSCRADDLVDEVLRVMATERVRRMPVVDDLGRVIGMISVDDVAAAALRVPDVSPGEVVAALAAIAHSRTARARRDAHDTDPAPISKARAGGADPAR
jgi:CBS domain-containing protein